MTIRSNVDRSRLDQRITLQRATVTQNADGDPVTTWADLIACWCAADATKASERLEASAVHTVGAVTFWIRADVFTRKRLTSEDRLIWKGKVFDILDIPDQQARGRLIAIFAQRGLSDG